MKAATAFCMLVSSGMVFVALLNALSYYYFRSAADHPYGAGAAVSRTARTTAGGSSGGDGSSGSIYDRLREFRMFQKDHPSGARLAAPGNKNNVINSTTMSSPFSACLLIKDDNDILDEWLAYHYHTLNLRYLVVAVDPSSTTSPVPVFDKWRNLTDLEVTVWSDADFMPQSFLEKGYHIPPRYVIKDANKSQWHEGWEDPARVVADRMKINNHRFRQVSFLGACYRHVRNSPNRDLTIHIDTDEYLVVNPLLRSHQSLRGSIPVPSGVGEPNSIGKFIRRIREDEFLSRQSNFPCVSMPRLLFGSVEDESQRDAERLLEMHLTMGGGFNATTFETLRWKYRAALNDTERNAQPKVLVDVSRGAVPDGDEMFQPKPFSIHRPSKALCRRLDQMSIPQYQRFPFVVNHYIGPYDRYVARNDTRRSRRMYDFKANVRDGGRDDWIATGDWLGGFVDAVGRSKARLLLGTHLA